METAKRPSRRVLIVARLILGLAGLVLGLFVAEIGLRLFLPQPLALSHRNPSGLTVHIPNGSVRLIRQEFDVVSTFNSLGLRDREFPFEKPAGVTRVLVLGDSYPEGVQVPVDQTFPKQLETKLASRYPAERTEVINAGVSGFGTGEEIKMYEEIGRRFHPDLVVLAVTVGNDLNDNRNTPYFGWHDEKLTETPVEPLSRYELFTAGLKEFATSHLHVMQFLRDRLHTLGNRGGDGGGGKGGVLLGHRIDMLRAEPDPEIERSWRKTEALIDRLRSEIEADGARLLLVAIPLRLQVEDEEWTKLQTKAAYPLDRTIPQRRLTAYADARGLPCVDLLPALRETNHLEQTYFKIEGHFTARGHEVAAEEILKALKTPPPAPLAP